MEDISRESKYHVLYGFYYVLFKRRWMIVFTFFFTFLLVFLSTLLIEPTYKAVCKVMVRHDRKQDFTLYKDMQQFSMGMNWRVNPLANFVELASSREMAAELVRLFQLDERLRESKENPQTFRDRYKNVHERILRSPFDLVIWGLEKLRLRSQEEEVVDYFQLAIDKQQNETQNIIVVAETEIISIEIWGQSSDEASVIANFIGERLIEKVREVDFREAETALSFAREQYQRIFDQLGVAERRLLDHKVRHGIVDPIEERKILNKKLELFETQVAVEETRKVEIDSSIHNMKKTLKNDFVPSRVYQSFTTQLTESEKEIGALGDKVLAMKKGIDATKEKIHWLDGEGLTLDAMARDIDTKLRQLQLLREAIEKLEVQRLTRLSEHDFIVIERAVPWKSMSPSWPLYLVNLVLGILGGLSLGLLVPFLVEFWRETFTSPTQVEMHMGLPVVAILPELRQRDITAGFRCMVS